MFKKKIGGGIVITKGMGVTLTKIDEKMIRNILQNYKIHVSQQFLSFTKRFEIHYSLLNQFLPPPFRCFFFVSFDAFRIAM